MSLNYRTHPPGPIHVGDHLVVGLHPTLRIPDVPGDRNTYPLPANLGDKPLYPLLAHQEAVPGSWKGRDGLLTPVYAFEALFLAFDAPKFKPHLLKIAVGGINVITGQPISDDFDGPQDFVVVPGQDYLDGIKTGDGKVRQFVMVPLGLGDTIAEQVAGAPEAGLEIRVFPPPDGFIPNLPPEPIRDLVFKGAQQTYSFNFRGAAEAAQLGVGAGGILRQKIAPLPYYIPLDTFRGVEPTIIPIYTMDATMIKQLTGIEPPPSPISRDEYRRHGFPYFEQYDVGREKAAVNQDLARVKSLGQRGAAYGFILDERGYEVPNREIIKLPSVSPFAPPIQELP